MNSSETYPPGEMVLGQESSHADGDAQQLAALFCLAFAMAVMLVGVAGPDPRLTVDGVPLATLLFVFAAILAAAVPCLPGTRKLALLSILTVGLLALTVPISLDPSGGTDKLLNLLASSLVATILMAAAVQRLGTEPTLRWLIVMLTVLLVGAIVYKSRYGFFDRQVLFLMNGPIVFARLMGLACIFSLVALRGGLRILLTIVFFLAVVWTASKGPILAVLLTILLYVTFMGSRGERLGFLALLGSMVVGVFANYDRLSEWEPLGRIFLAIDALSAIGGTETDSVGSRILLLQESVQVIRERPLGIGVGSWSAYTGIRWATYPHNFFLEIWNEGGLLLGTVAALPYLLFLLRRPDAWWLASMFLLLCQQVSGDLLDSRYWLVFSVVGFLCRPEGAALRSIRPDSAGLRE